MASWPEPQASEYLREYDRSHADADCCCLWGKACCNVEMGLAICAGYIWAWTFLHIELVWSYGCLHFSDLCLNSTWQHIISSGFLYFIFQVPFTDFPGLRILLMCIKRKTITRKSYTYAPFLKSCLFFFPCLLLHSVYRKREGRLWKLNPPFLF